MIYTILYHTLWFYVKTSNLIFQCILNINICKGIGVIMMMGQSWWFWKVCMWTVVLSIYICISLSGFGLLLLFVESTLDGKQMSLLLTSFLSLCFRQVGSFLIVPHWAKPSLFLTIYSNGIWLDAATMQILGNPYIMHSVNIPCSLSLNKNAHY